MKTLPKFLSAVASTAIISLLLTAGCGTQPTHPNQLNTFDGSCYNGLIVAQAALNSLRTPISTDFPKYSSAFNGAVEAYETAVSAYIAYRSAPNVPAAATAALENLAVSLVTLESAMQSDMKVPPAATAQIRKQAAKIRSSSAAVSATDILTELQIAAAVAQAVLGTNENVALASIVIQATQVALTAENATAGQLIDLSALQAVTPLP